MSDYELSAREKELQRSMREVAYMLWEASGHMHGRSLEFWLAAEAEVLAEADAIHELCDTAASENRLAFDVPRDVKGDAASSQPAPQPASPVADATRAGSRRPERAPDTEPR